MELEIGMYARTINGKIWAIKSQQAISGHKKDIINASYNIIDLIEVGDYVNGERVFGFGKFIYDDGTEEITSLTLDTTISCLPEDIKSIVTKEQFESMEYKIGDKENDK